MTQSSTYLIKLTTLLLFFEGVTTTLFAMEEKNAFRPRCLPTKLLDSKPTWSDSFPNRLHQYPELTQNVPFPFAWEIKSSMTLSSDFFKVLKQLEKLTPGLKKKSVIYGGDKKITREGVQILPWNQIAQSFV